MKKLTTLSLIALAAAVFSNSAHAQIATVSAGGTDLILAFGVDDSAGQGNGTNLEVDLGSFSLFTNTSVYTSNPATNLNVADLVSTYGANWSTRGDLVFNVAGDVTVQDAAPASGQAYSYVTQSGTPQVSTSAFNEGASGNILSEENELRTTGTPTLDSTGSGTLTGSTPGALNSEDLKTGGQYGFFTEKQILDPTTAATLGYLADTEATVSGAVTALNLYAYPEGSGRSGTAPTLLGTFDLNAAGVLTYTGADAVPTPEPSTWAMLLGGLGFIGLAVRRRWMTILG